MEITISQEQGRVAVSVIRISWTFGRSNISGPDRKSARGREGWHQKYFVGSQ